MTEEREPNNKEVSFEGFFTADTWKFILKTIRDYFSENEKIFKFIGFSVAISGLFLAMDGEDPHLKRIQAFFLCTTILLISGFVIRSVFLLHQGKHGNIYNNVVLIPTYIGGVLIFNFLVFLINKFANELFYYLYWLGVPLLGLLIHFLFVIYFKLLSRFKKIEGGQIKNFFLFTLDINIFVTYFSSDTFFEAINKLSTFGTSHKFLIFLFIFSTYSELFPLREWKSRTARIIDLSIMGTLTVVLFGWAFWSLKDVVAICQRIF